MAKIDEDKDLALVEQLLFKPRGLNVQRFSQAELRTTRTPDFRVFKGARHMAHCEVKSPNDPWLDNL